MTIDQTERLLSTGQVAVLFRVRPKTVARWASTGRVGCIRTPGGHRRFPESEIRALLAAVAAPAEWSTG
ncbi:MAG TPA: BldC family transcriptional regulator [Nakamurella sp.]|jgi:excisionase family DNA binding protein|nr:BldC family transcriptional regulator [Nakamurella sp.]